MKVTINMPSKVRTDYHQHYLSEYEEILTKCNLIWYSISIENTNSVSSKHHLYTLNKIISWLNFYYIPDWGFIACETEI